MSLSSEMKAAVARIELVHHTPAGADGALVEVLQYGSGVLLSSNLVLTAHHVLVSNTNEVPADDLRVRVRFRRPNGEEITVGAAWTDVFSSVLDFAVLELDQSIGIAPIALGGRVSGAEVWRAFGYPMATTTTHEWDGFSARGEIIDIDGRYGGQRALQLTSAQADGLQAQGMSGSPVLCGDRVVGILRAILPDERGRATANTLFACPVGAMGGIEDLVHPHSTTSAPITLSETLQIDRHIQWNHLVELVSGDKSGAVVIHGNHKQNLDAFTRRLRLDLARHTRRDLQVVQVPFEVDGERLAPRTSSEWLRVMAQQLDEEAAANPLQIFSESAKSLSNVVVCDVPLPDGADLLQEFVNLRLGAVIAAVDQGNPVFFVFVATYTTAKPSGRSAEMLSALEGLYLGGHQPITVVRQVKFPDTDDVEDFLKKYRCSASVCRVVREKHEFYQSRDDFDGFATFVQHAINQSKDEAQ